MPVNNDPSRPRPPAASPTAPAAPPSNAAPRAPEAVRPPPVPGRPEGQPRLEAEVPSDLFNRDAQPLLPRAKVAVAGDAPAVLQPFDALIPDLPRLPSLEKLIERFGKDFAVLSHQIIHAPGQTPEQKAERLLQFFLAYASRFVSLVELQHPGAHRGNAQDGKGGNLFKSDPALSQALRAMLEALRENGYEQLRDAATGRSALIAARELLTSTPPQFQQKAAAAQWVPAPAPPTEQSLQNPDRPSWTEQAGRAVASEQRRPEERLLPERMKVASWGAEAARAPVVAPRDADGARDQAEEFGARGTPRRLGGRMLWNVLHRFRGSEEDLATNQEKWDRLTFGAILALVGISLAVVLLANL